MADRQIPRRATTSSNGVELGDFGFFLNAFFSFLILAAVVYFAVVMPYTRAKERYFPSPEPGTPEDIVLLSEIRDLLKAQQGGTPTGSTV